MRILANVPFAAVSMLLLGATCIANVEQKGPEGPWVGEVVNMGEQPVNHVQVLPRIFDATGRQVFGGGGVADTCPFILFPGERGAFEVFFERAQDGAPEPVPPLRAEFPEIAVEYPGAVGLASHGLLAEVVSEKPDQLFVRVRLTNSSNHRYSDLTVCGVLRTPDGRLAEVGRAAGPGYTGEATTMLLPDEAIELDVFFNTMPEGSIRLHPAGLIRDPAPSCCMPGPGVDWFSVKNHHFSAMLPPGWAYEPLQGIDSFVGRYHGDGAELTFDYGFYSDPLNYDADPVYDVHEETIGGLTAKIVRTKGAPGLTGVHFAFIESSQFPGDNIPFDVRLTITGQNLSTAHQEIAMQIFRSIRFTE